MSELERRVAVQMRELAERGRRVSELESELETVRAQLAAAQAETAELRQARVAAEELDRRLAIRTEELNAVTRQLIAFEGSVRTLERALAELQSATEGLREERAGLVERVDTLTLQNEGLVQTLARRERSEQALALEVRRLHDAEARAGELEAHVERLERERAQTLSDVRRVAASRAWRLGHGATTLLRRATFRPVRTGGALDAIIDRLDVPKSPARLELPPGRQQLPAGPAEDASPDAS
jgi:chromosome segregation ATPase